MKSKKLKLSDLKVKSFVTELKKENEKSVHGGNRLTGTRGIDCPVSHVCFLTQQDCVSYPPACYDPGIL